MDTRCFLGRKASAFSIKPKHHSSTFFGCLRKKRLCNSIIAYR